MPLALDHLPFGRFERSSQGRHIDSDKHTGV
jgi:hypothetical protein